jgi:hypothetical protein
MVRGEFDGRELREMLRFASSAFLRRRQSGQPGPGEHGNASMRILVTGATGFIERALTQHLIVLGHDIACAIRRP